MRNERVRPKPQCDSILAAKLRTRCNGLCNRCRRGVTVFPLSSLAEGVERPCGSVPKSLCLRQRSSEPLLVATGDGLIDLDEDAEVEDFIEARTTRFWERESETPGVI